MRLLQGRSRYNLACCRRLSHFYRFCSISATTANDGVLNNGLDGKHVVASASLAPNRNDAVTAVDSSCFCGRFEDFNALLCDRVVRSLHCWGFFFSTVIQKLSIPKIIDGCDVLIRSATGSGKTLTFLVPALQRLVQRGDGYKISRKDGTMVMIICPTRELSEQTKDTASKLSRPFPWIVVASIKALVGGDSRKSEKAQIRKGITMLIGTPGRVLDHCEKTCSFKVSNLEMFVLDEADRLLDMGFETKIRSIYRFLSSSKSNVGTCALQTVMTSATLTDTVQKLAKFCLRTKPVTIGIDDDIISMPSTLIHEYVLVDCKDKLMCLISLLLKYVDNGDKVIVFVSSCKSVIYLHLLLQSLTWPTIEGLKKERADPRGPFSHKMERYSSVIEDYEKKAGDILGGFKRVDANRPSGISVFNNVAILMLHGSMEANDRAGYVNDFMSNKSGILVSTDVASRGLNLLEVNRVIQYDPPQQLEEYIHRAGRTARLGGKGSAILILMQHEVHFINALRKRGVCVKQVMEGLVWSYIEQIHIPKQLRNFKGYNVSFLRNCFCELVCHDSALLTAGQVAFRASVRAYKTYSKDLRRIFDFRKLHLGHYATSFFLKQKPSDIMHDASYETVGVGSKLMGKKSDHSKPVQKRHRIIGRRKSRLKTPKSCLLSTSASDAAHQALQLLRARNQVLQKRCTAP